MFRDRTRGVSTPENYIRLRLLTPLMLLLAFLVEASAATFALPDAKQHSDPFVWTDTCNIRVVPAGGFAVSSACTCSPRQKFPLARPRKLFILNTCLDVACAA